jgi:putative acetyltransferase
VEEITVRRATVADAPTFARILGDPSVFPQTLQMPYASVDGIGDWLRETLARDRHDVLLVAERGGEAVGSAGLHPTGPRLRRRHAMFLGISVPAHAQRSGVGSALMRALLDYADGWAQVLRIELTVFADNAPAIALYRRFGFEVEGTLRAYALRDGVFVDALAMARLHPRPPRLPA